jgi:hypothetical protein
VNIIISLGDMQLHRTGTTQGTSAAMALVASFALIEPIMTHSVDLTSAGFRHVGVGFCRDTLNDSAWGGVYKWACLDFKACIAKCAGESGCVGVAHTYHPPAGASDCADAGQPRCVTYFGPSITQTGKHLGGNHALSYECYARNTPRSTPT